MLQITLTTIDWLVFFFIFALTILSVIYGNLRKKKVENEEEDYIDLILMGRRLTLPLFVATLVATWYGGIFGVAELAFNKGIYNFLTQGVFWYITYLIFAFFMVSNIRKSQAKTLPDLIGKEFGAKSAKIAAWLNLINVIPISYAISVGLFLQVLFGGSLIFNTTVGVILVMAYSTYGGFRAVVYSDLVQFFVMVSTVILIAFFSYNEYGGIDYLQAKLPSTHFDPTGGEKISSLLVWGIIALSTLVDPNFYQRVLAAKDVKTARNGILIATVVWVIFDLAMTAGALYARAVMPEANSQTAYLEFAIHILPPGLRGFALAGILATIISTLDSYIFIGATTLITDILDYNKIKNHTRAHHFAVILIGFFAIAASYLFKGNIIKVWKLFGSLSSSCLLIPVVVGKIFKTRIRDKQFFYASISGASFIFIWKIIDQVTDLPSIDELYLGSFMSLSVLTFFIIKKPTS
jgi:solute:Na+ symporter, SSS family